MAYENGQSLPNNLNNNLVNIARGDLTRNRKSFNSENYNILPNDLVKMGREDISNLLNSGRSNLLSSHPENIGRGWNWKKLNYLYSDNSNVLTNNNNLLSNDLLNIARAGNSNNNLLNVGREGNLESSGLLNSEYSNLLPSELVNVGRQGSSNYVYSSVNNVQPANIPRLRTGGYTENQDDDTAAKRLKATMAIYLGLSDYAEGLISTPKPESSFVTPY